MERSCGATGLRIHWYEREWQLGYNVCQGLLGSFKWWCLSNIVTDAELISRVAGKDKLAFSELYDRYAQVVYNLCVRILREEAEAQDVLQDIFVQVWKNAKRYDAARASFKTWLFMIARSRSLDRYRSRKSSQSRVQLHSNEDLYWVSSEENLEEIGLMQAYVLHALSQLSSEQRKVVELSYFEGYTQEEIAEQLREPLGTVKSRIRAALMKLRSAFSGERSYV